MSLPVTRPFTLSPIPLGRLGPALLFGLVLLIFLRADARAQETIDCGQAACVQFSPTTPTELITGRSHTFYINYRFLDGDYGFQDPVSGEQIGARIVFESSDYFLGSNIFSNATWTGGCELVQSNPWKIGCEWTRAPWVQSATENSVENVWVVVRSQTGDTPDGYAAIFRARLETKRTVDADMLVHEDEHTLIVDGEANIRFENFNRFGRGYGYIPDGSGGFIPGRRHGIMFIASNYIRPSDFTDPPHPTWAEYIPPLWDASMFDQNVFERAGGNSVEDLQVEITIPEWAHFYGVDFGWSGIWRRRAAWRSSVATGCSSATLARRVGAGSRFSSAGQMHVGLNTSPRRPMAPSSSARPASRVPSTASSPSTRAATGASRPFAPPNNAGWRTRSSPPMARASRGPNALTRRTCGSRSCRPEGPSTREAGWHP
jgi:hypothetical protein